MTAARPVSWIFGAVGCFPPPSFLESTLCPLVVGALFRGLFASSAGGLAHCFLHSPFVRRAALFPGFCARTVDGWTLCCLEFSLGRLVSGRLVPRIICLVGSVWVSILQTLLSIGWWLGTQLHDSPAQSVGGWAQCCLDPPISRMAAMFLGFCLVVCALCV